MTQRLLVLTGYFLRRLIFSLSGIIYIIFGLIYWLLLFSPGQGTPDSEYYILVIGVFGAVLTFLSALTVAARANRAANYPMVVRLPSRVEFLAAVLFTSMLFAAALQLLVAGLALINGPDLPLTTILVIPPVWFAVNSVAAVLALHASDFVTVSWSRVYIFGGLAILLFGQNAKEPVGTWLSNRLIGLSRTLMNSGQIDIASSISDWAVRISENNSELLGNAFGLLFWPFRAMTDAVVAHSFGPAQALAPAIVLLYATILFMLAADLFGSKDLDFLE